MGPCMAPFTCSVTQIKGTIDEYVDVRAKCEQGFNLDGRIMTFHGAGFFFLVGADDTLFAHFVFIIRSPTSVLYNCVISRKF